MVLENPGKCTQKEVMENHFQHSVCTLRNTLATMFIERDEFVLTYLQEPKADKDEENCRKLNEYLNNPPAPGSTRSASGGVGSLPSELSSLGGFMSYDMFSALFQDVCGA